jgi:hypothetical protein
MLLLYYRINVADRGIAKESGFSSQQGQEIFFSILSGIYTDISTETKFYFSPVLIHMNIRFVLPQYENGYIVG